MPEAPKELTEAERLANLEWEQRVTAAAKRARIILADRPLEEVAAEVNARSTGAGFLPTQRPSEPSSELELKDILSIANLVLHVTDDIE